MGFSSNCKLGTATTIGVALSTIGAVFTVYWPSLFDNVLNNQLALSNNSKSYGLWEVTPIPMYIEFYFFNWTNPKDLHDPNKKPILVEVGPYVFREHRVKVVQDWFPLNDTVTYFQNRIWFFEQSMSKGYLNDTIFTVNIPAITATHALQDSKYSAAKGALNLIMEFLGIKIWVKKTVGEFLFDGYGDPLLDLAKLMPSAVVPVTIPFDKFGWFYKRNGSATYDGLFNMFTGRDDITKFGEMGEWNHVKSTTYYKSYCANVNGSAGEFFPPKQTKQPISLFVPDICRTLNLNFKEETEVDGIAGYRYWADDTMFDNATTRPDNWCFCPAGGCPPNGVMDISSCKWGAPAYISFPHFFHADPWYRSTVEGMEPNETKHQMFMDLEPNSGIPLEVSAALQINILLQPMKEFSILRNVPKIYFPAIWFRQTAHIDDSIGPEVKLLSIIPTIGFVIFYIILSTGVTSLFVIGICYVTMRCRNEEDRVILVNS
ncbi:Protein croquemort [Folsomia candida]|uniref:Protein croquemort n=1 Tax=Folsomia candida TaxID=158441 RepID=A0A226EP64_FOLCA|nr:Protein croquemort [Folsomia candida]